VIVLIVVYHARTGASLVMSVALGLLLGGAIGNVADRLRYGYVTRPARPAAVDAD